MRIHLGCCLALALATGMGMAAEPPTTPILRIETGMHTATIKRLATDAANRYLVTGSHDKTVRVWDLSTGRLLQVLRPPIGPWNEGKVYAVAMSPDGTTVACGGWTGWDWDGQASIYLFDRASGRLARRVTGLPNVIFRLAYSSDGRFLAATLGEKNGVRVYRAPEYALLGEDKDYGGPSNGATFDRQGRLATTCDDGFIRLYDSRVKLIARKKAPGGNAPYSISFSPDSSRLAVGFEDSTKVAVLSGENLEPLYAPDTKGVDNGKLGNVAWSVDGRVLYAGGIHDVRGVNHIRKWSDAGRGNYADLPRPENSIMDLVALLGGGVAFGAADPAWGVLDAEDKLRMFQGPAIPDYRGMLDAFLISPDGSTIQLCYEFMGKSPARLSLSTRTLAVLDPGHRKPTTENLSPPLTSAPGLTITDWKNSRTPKLNGKPLSLKQYERCRSLAIAPDRQSFLLGTEWYLRLFDGSGREKWRADVPDVAWGVNIAGNGKAAAAAFGDGTIRWFRMQDGQEVLAFFPHNPSSRASLAAGVPAAPSPRGPEAAAVPSSSAAGAGTAPQRGAWVMWTPEGFFDCSPGAESLIGYHLNQGKDREGEFVGLDQLYDLFYRPDLVAKKLTGEGDEEIRAELARIGDVREILRAGLPPVVEIVSPSQGAQLSQRDIRVRVRVTERSGGLGRLRYRLNDVAIGEEEGTRGPGGVTNMVERTFTMQPGENRIAVSAFDRRNRVESRLASVGVTLRDAISDKPRLFVLTVGINQYRDRALHLAYAAADAQAVGQELRVRGGRLFEDVVVVSLNDSQATVPGLREAFTKLAQDIKTSDVFVLYASGHGMALGGQYYLLPWDLVYQNEDTVREKAVSQAELERLLAMVPALKSMVLLDTCQAGAFTKRTERGLAEKTAMDKLMRATGRAVIAASSEAQAALEGYEGHGVFTFALLEGLRGSADAKGNNDKEISINELADYVGDRVPELTRKKWGYEQFPMQNLHGRSFPIGLRD